MSDEAADFIRSFEATAAKVIASGAQTQEECRRVAGMLEKVLAVGKTERTADAPKARKDLARDLVADITGEAADHLVDAGSKALAGLFGKKKGKR